MRDLVLFAHVIIGLALIVLPILILLELKKQSYWLKALSLITAVLSWLLLLPSAVLYITFYPATKTLINAGSKPWLHSILMETKEHWGLLIPIIATTAAGLTLTNKSEESRKWWILLMILAGLIGAMGRIIKMGAV